MDNKYLIVKDNLITNFILAQTDSDIPLKPGETIVEYSPESGSSTIGSYWDSSLETFIGITNTSNNGDQIPNPLTSSFAVTYSFNNNINTDNINTDNISSLNINGSPDGISISDLNIESKSISFLLSASLVPDVSSSDLSFYLKGIRDIYNREINNLSNPVNFTYSVS
jgi:hypothetical protein